LGHVATVIFYGSTGIGADSEILRNVRWCESRSLPRTVGSRGLLQRRRIDRHLAQTLSGRGKDCIGNGGNDRRRPGLAHAARRLHASHEVDLDLRYLVDTQYLVGIEVGLLDTAVFQRNLAMKGRGGAEDNSALDLRLHCVRINDGAAIYRTDHAANADIALLRHFDLGNLRQVAAKRELE